MYIMKRHSSKTEFYINSLNTVLGLCLYFCIEKENLVAGSSGWCLSFQLTLL